MLVSGRVVVCVVFFFGGGGLVLLCIFVAWVLRILEMGPISGFQLYEKKQKKTASGL